MRKKHLQNVELLSCQHKNNTNTRNNISQTNEYIFGHIYSINLNKYFIHLSVIFQTIIKLNDIIDGTLLNTQDNSLSFS
jgi:hypothetical protein